MANQKAELKAKSPPNRSKALNFLQLDASSMVPHYQQLEDQLSEAIRNEHLGPGDPLPSERELAERLGISRMTVRRALTNLEKLGVLQSQVGKGWFVSTTDIEHALTKVLGTNPMTTRRIITKLENQGAITNQASGIRWVVSPSKIEQILDQLTGFSADMHTAGFDVSSEVIEFKKITAPKKIAQRLGSDEEVTVYYLERLRRVDGKVIGLEQPHIPESVCPQLERFDFSNHSLYEVMREEYGHTLAWAVQDIEASLPNWREAALLGIEQELPVLRATRTVFSPEGTILEASSALYRGDRYKYQVLLEGGNYKAVIQ